LSVTPRGGQGGSIDLAVDVVVRRFSKNRSGLTVENQSTSSTLVRVPAGQSLALRNADDVIVLTPSSQ
jgi:hypothetical protein